MEDGKNITSKYGTPQGSILSPVLANIVMYYGIVLYVKKIKVMARGYIEIVNYADDNVLCFQYKNEAVKTYNTLRKRLEGLQLEFAEEKTRLIEFRKICRRKCQEKGEKQSRNI